MMTRDKRQSILLSRLIFLVIIVCMIIVIAILFKPDLPKKYELLWIMPASYMLLSVIFGKIYFLIGKSITVTILILLMFLKNVIVPFVMVMGDGAFRASVDTSNNMLYAIGLEMYEEIAIFILIYLLYKKMVLGINESSNNDISVKIDNVKSFWIGTGILFLIALLCVAIYPQLGAYLNMGIPGSEVENIALTRLKIAMKENTPTIVYYFYIEIVNLLRWIIPISIICFLSIFGKFNDGVKFIISFACIGISALFNTENYATSVFIALALTWWISKIYKNLNKKILFSSLGIIGFIGGFAFLFKTLGDEGMQSTQWGQIANLLQAYFSGPENVAIAGMISEPLTIKVIIGDIFKFVPYVMYFFKEYISSNMYFNHVFWGETDNYTQILPMIAHGAIYFSSLLAPIFTLLCSGLAIFWELNACKKNTILGHALASVACVYFSMSIAMYNASLMLQLYFESILPLQLLITFITKINVYSYYKKVKSLIVQHYKRSQS